MGKRNHTGHRVGEWHGRAKMSSAQVASMRADYIPHVFGLTKVAKKHNCPRSTARDICTYATRSAD
ncbi:MAG: hypothetical protein COA41_11180 [Sphingopyxis sp.]|nr:MAG: hypothetical protein COA41_11180 [Sphingopyxis sp.]